MNWKEAASLCEDLYGIYVNWEENYFICPECDEPILEEDWGNHDFSMCPICEFLFQD